MRAVFFDIDNTLYSYDIGNQAGMEALEDYAVHTLKVSPEKFHQAFRQAMTVVKERIGCDCAATHNRLIRMQCILEILKKPLYPHAKMMYHRYWDNLIGISQPEEGVRELFMALKVKGIGIGIGTDMTAYIQYQKLEKLGLAPYVDWMVTSEEAGAEKPSERFFRLCAQKAGGDPKECIFVGDSLKKDVIGSSEYGFVGVWYRKNPTEKEAATYPIITSFRDCIQGDVIRFGEKIIL